MHVALPRPCNFGVNFFFSLFRGPKHFTIRALVSVCFRTHDMMANLYTRNNIAISLNVARMRTTPSHLNLLYMGFIFDTVCRYIRCRRATQNRRAQFFNMPIFHFIEEKLYNIIPNNQAICHAQFEKRNISKSPNVFKIVQLYNGLIEAHRIRLQSYYLHIVRPLEAFDL